MNSVRNFLNAISKFTSGSCNEEGIIIDKRRGQIKIDYDLLLSSERESDFEDQRLIWKNLGSNRDRSLTWKNISS